MPSPVRYGSIKARAAWLADVERHIVAARPDLSGRLHWPTLRFMYDSGTRTSVAAAAEYLASDPPAVDNGPTQD